MKTLGPTHIAALLELASGQPVTQTRGGRGLWLRGLAETDPADPTGSRLRLTAAGLAAVAEISPQ